MRQASRKLRGHLVWRWLLCGAFVVGEGRGVLAAMPTEFLPGVAVGSLEHADLDEASGLAASQVNEGLLWVHNDSGDLPTVYAVDAAGRHHGAYTLTDANNSDWEDVAIGPGPVDGQSYLYVGDIGDNRASRSEIHVYRVAEPQLDRGEASGDQILDGVETLSFQYPDGPRDAETLLVDPRSGDLYILSKRDDEPRLYRAPFPQSAGGTTTLELLGNIRWEENSLVNWPTAGDVSPQGDEVLIRGYAIARHWTIPPGTSLGAVLTQTEGRPVPLALEAQGEALAFDADGRNYFSVSEGLHASLYLYERVPEPTSLLMAWGSISAALCLRRRRG